MPTDDSRHEIHTLRRSLRRTQAALGLLALAMGAGGFALGAGRLQPKVAVFDEIEAKSITVNGDRLGRISITCVDDAPTILLSRGTGTRTHASVHLGVIPDFTGFVRVSGLEHTNTVNLQAGERVASLHLGTSEYRPVELAATNGDGEIVLRNRDFGSVLLESGGGDGGRVRAVYNDGTRYSLTPYTDPVPEQRQYEKPQK